MTILKDESHKLRGPAAYALANIGEKQAVPLLEKLLAQNGDVRLRILGASGLARLEPDNEARLRSSIPLLIEGLGDRWAVIRHESAAALRVFGSGAAPAVPRLAACLQDPQATLRVDFLWTLGEIGPAAAPALPDIVRLMNKDEFPVRYAACYAAGRIGRAASVAIPILLNNLDSRDEFLQFMSAWAYVHIATPRDEVADLCLQPLRRGLKQADPRARTQAAAGLGRLGAGAREALPDLRDMARDEDPVVRHAVAEALDRIDR